MISCRKASRPCSGRRHLFEKETRLGDRFEVDGKKRGDDLDHRDHRLSAIEGGRDGGVQKIVKIIKGEFLKALSCFLKLNYKLLDQSKQLGKEIGNEECVRKYQCPTSDSPGIEFYPSPFFCFPNTKEFLAAHLLLRR